MRAFPISTALCGILLTFPPLLHAAPEISEILASNLSGLKDGDGNFTDWIEVHNPDGTAIDLSGYHLTDDNEVLAKWTFPVGTMLTPDQRIIVFASGQASGDYQDSAGNLHTNFSLSANGEFLALVATDGETIVSGFDPSYPKLRPDISWSRDGYYTNPTPGAPEDSGSLLLGFVEDTKFSVKRGFYTEPFTVELATATEGAQIRYTTDGSEPTEENGTTYATAINVSTTTVLRAKALKEGFEPTNIDTQTYLFLADVLRQQQDPDGYPTTWGGVRADYEMDAEVVDDPVYRDDFQAAFTRIPTLSLVTDIDNLFHTSRGIYQRPTSEGTAWERPVSAEFFTADGSEPGFNANCGIRIQGGSSRQTDIPKHSFSLRFREDYGVSRLQYPLYKNAPFGDTAVEEFDVLQLRATFNHSWFHRHYYQNDVAQYNRDQWVNDLFQEMGQPGTRGRWAHLYINGIYWGIYHMHERPDARYMASYFGGSRDDYDVINSNIAVDGNTTAWRAVNSIAMSNRISTPEGYAEIRQVLDVDNLIDYMLLNFYVGNWDWDGHNWRSARRRSDDGKWIFFPWDSEFAIAPNGTGRITNPSGIEGALNVDRTTVSGANRPSGLHSRLVRNEEYRLRFADRIQKHMFNGGALTPDFARATWKRRSDLMDDIIIAESARWGDYKRDLVPGAWPASNYQLYTKNDPYLPVQDYILNTYITQRTAIVLNQFKRRNLYPDTVAPALLINDAPQHGGNVSAGATLAFSVPGNAGAVIYTLNGSDPHGSAPEIVIEEVIAADAPLTVWIPDSAALEEAEPNWRAVDFDDASWMQGTGGVGFDRGGDFQEHFGVDLIDSMWTKGSSAYVRIPFNLSNPGKYALITLQAKYEDGFIAYINGTEVARANAPDTPGWNSVSTSTHADADAVVYEDFEFTVPANLLIEGKNVLAIQGLNSSATGSDFLLAVWMDAGSVLEGDGGTRFDGTPIALQPGAVRVSARVLDGDEWSPLTEATFIVGAQSAAPGNLVISELHYNPSGGTDSEFVELLNTSDTTIRLEGVHFSSGIDYTFVGNQLLTPGERIVIVSNLDVFRQVYGEAVSTITIAGEFARNLSNAGEEVVLSGSDDAEIFRFTYDDSGAWPAEADGGGRSLVFAGGDPADPASWSASSADGGSPGTAPGSGSGFDSWMLANGFADPLADPDGDGLSHMATYFTGADLVADVHGFLDITSAGTLTLRRRSALSGLTGIVEFSMDLESWTALGTDAFAPAVDAGDGTEQLSATLDAPGNVLYLRIRISR
ncbi:MAG: lamin tail domain-containing protein [Verrucomicrobiales bacterium]